MRTVSYTGGRIRPLTVEQEAVAQAVLAHLAARHRRLFRRFLGLCRRTILFVAAVTAILAMLRQYELL